MPSPNTSHQPIPKNAHEAEIHFRCLSAGCTLSGLSCAKRWERANAEKAPAGAFAADAGCYGCPAGCARSAFLCEANVKSTPISDLPENLRPTSTPPKAEDLPAPGSPSFKERLLAEEIERERLLCGDDYPRKEEGRGPLGGGEEEREEETPGGGGSESGEEARLHPAYTNEELKRWYAEAWAEGAGGRPEDFEIKFVVCGADKMRGGLETIVSEAKTETISVGPSLTAAIPEEAPASCNLVDDSEWDLRAEEMTNINIDIARRMAEREALTQETALIRAIGEDAYVELHCAKKRHEETGRKVGELESKLPPTLAPYMGAPLPRTEMERIWERAKERLESEDQQAEDVLDLCSENDTLRGTVRRLEKQCADALPSSVHQEINADLEQSAESYFTAINNHTDTHAALTQLFEHTDAAEQIEGHRLSDLTLLDMVNAITRAVLASERERNDAEAEQLAASKKMRVQIAEALLMEVNGHAPTTGEIVERVSEVMCSHSQAPFDESTINGLRETIERIADERDTLRDEKEHHRLDAALDTLERLLVYVEGVPEMRDERPRGEGYTDSQLDLASRLAKFARELILKGAQADQPQSSPNPHGITAMLAEAEGEIARLAGENHLLRLKIRRAD